MERFKNIMNMLKEHSMAAAMAGCIATAGLTVIMLAAPLPLAWDFVLLLFAAVLNYKDFLNCASALAAKTIDENFLPLLAVVISAAALEPGYAGAVLTAEAFAGLICKVIIPKRYEEGQRNLAEGGSLNIYGGFRPSGKTAIYFACAGCMVFLVWMIATSVGGSVQWKEGLLHSGAFMAAVCGLDFMCGKKLALKKARRQMEDAGIHLHKKSDDDLSEETIENIGKTDVIFIEQKNIVTLTENIVTDITAFYDITEEELLYLFETGEKSRKGPVGKRTEFTENGKNYMTGKPTQIKGAPRNDRHWQQALGQADIMRRMGRIPVLICDSDRILGMLSVEEKLNPTAAEGITMMGAMGIEAVMFSENDRLTADSTGRKAGVRKVYAGASRANKRTLIAEAEAAGKKTAFMGETLKAVMGMGAEVTIAIGPGGAADAEAEDNNLLRIEKMFKGGRKFIDKLRKGRKLSVAYDAAAMLLLTGLLYPICGFEADPLTGSAAFVCFILVRLVLSFW